MNNFQRSRKTEIQQDGSDEMSSKSFGSGITFSKPGFFPSNSELCIVHGYTHEALPDSQDPEKHAAILTEEHKEGSGGPPDGGLKAWSVVLGTCLTTCATLGYITAWGVFQTYYEEVMLPNSSPSDIAWIGSVQYAVVFLPGLIVGRLFDIGFFKIPFFLASCLLIVCTFLIAECKEYWQFFLVQGLGIGFSSGVLFGPTLAIVSHWFSKRRGLALGINAIGSSVGGITFPIAAQSLIPEVGFKWTMRIFGFIMIFTLGIANLTVDRRLPPVNVKGGLFNWVALKNPAYAVYCVSGTTAFLGMYTVLTYIPISAVQAGIPNDFAFYLIAIANGCSAAGRIIAGILGDMFGALEIMVPFTIVTAVTTFLWPFAESKAVLILLAVIYGFSYGTYISLLPVPVMSMGAMNDVGRRMGLFLTFAAFGALAGTPISGAINSTTGSFVDVGIYAGGILLLSVCLLLLTWRLQRDQLAAR